MDVSRRRPLLASAVVIGLLVVLARFAYFRMFSQFILYDDEGYVMQTIRSYLSGAPLYDSVFSLFGPGFYVFAWVLHRLLRIPLTHDAVRFVTIAWWLIASGLGAAIVFRLTRSVMMSALCVILLYGHLTPLINEPAHAQGILAVVVLLSCLVATDTRESTAVPRALALGALGAFAMLVKINVGTYLCAGLLLAMLLASPAPVFVRIAGVALGAVVPFALMRPFLGSFGGPYAVAVSTGVIAVSLIAGGRIRGALPGVRPFAAFSVSGAIAGMLLLVPALVGGTTVAGIMRDTLTQTERLRQLFVVPTSFPAHSVVVAGVSIAGCLTCALSAPWRRSNAAQTIVALVKLASFWLLVGSFQYSTLIAVYTPLLWLVLIVPGGDTDADARGALVARTTIALVAAFETLQAFPVAGSQLAFATDISMILAVVGICDGLAYFSARTQPSLQTALRFAVVVIALQIARPAFGFGLLKARFEAGYDLRLPGATRLRLESQQVATYHWLSATASASCSRLVTMPGTYSLNFWSGVRPPTDFNITAWHTLLYPREQAEIWSKLDAATAPCVIVNPATAVRWSGVPLDRIDAGSHLKGRPILAEADGNQFLMRPGTDVNATLVELVNGQQTFSAGRTALPVTADLARPGPRFTIRLWFRTSHSGAILSCQRDPDLKAPSPTLPIVYVGLSGALRSAEVPGETPARGVADGAWHYVALVHDADTRQLYVDDRPAVSVTSAHRDPAPLLTCQAGNGFAAGWLDADDGWMPLTGEVSSLAVVRQPWTPRQVAADRDRTRGSEKR